MQTNTSRLPPRPGGFSACVQLRKTAERHRRPLDATKNGTHGDYPHPLPQGSDQSLPPVVRQARQVQPHQVGHLLFRLAVELLERLRRSPRAQLLPDRVMGLLLREERVLLRRERGRGGVELVLRGEGELFFCFFFVRARGGNVRRFVQHSVRSVVVSFRGEGDVRAPVLPQTFLEGKEKKNKQKRTNSRPSSDPPAPAAGARSTAPGGTAAESGGPCRTPPPPGPY